MKRLIAILLIAIQLVVGLLFLTGGVVAYCRASRMAPVAELTILKNTLLQYAGSLDAKRDNLDRFGSRVIPGYAANLRELSVLLGDLEPLTTLLRQTASISTPAVLGLRPVKPLSGLEETAEDLEALLPRLSKTLAQSSDAFRAYTEEDHEKVIQSLDSTILVLRNTAEDLEEFAELLPGRLRMAAAGFLLFAGFLLLSTVTQILLLPPGKSPDERRFAR